jgi:putative ABC transport system substrate-binding protein
LPRFRHKTSTARREAKGTRREGEMNKRKLGRFALCAMLFALCSSAEAQQSKKFPRIGYLSSQSLSTNSTRIEAFRQGLRELGYVEGKNIVVEYRHAEGKQDRLPALAAELVRLKVDVIVIPGPLPTRVTKEATSTISIVMAQVGDPVGSGFVASLARPGGNITGLSTLAPELSGKRLELLKEIVPELPRGRLRDFNRPWQRANVKRGGACRGGVESAASIPRRPKSQGY